MKRFFNHILVALSAFASALTMISFFFRINWSEKPLLTWLIIAIIILLCVSYACIQVSRKSHIFIKISDNFQLTVEQGDIFEQKGVIVIPVNNYLDTHVGDGIIDPKSVHGQFIQSLFFDRVEELDNKIENSIQKQNLVGITVQPHTKGKNTKYQLGTCVDILDGGNLYVWVVTTEFDDNNIAVLSRKDLSNVMYGLFKHLEVVAGNNTVFMPIIGAGNARLNRSAERILHYLIDYFDFSLSDMKVLGGIHIMIPSIKGVNLNRLENLFNK